MTSENQLYPRPRRRDLESKSTPSVSVRVLPATLLTLLVALVFPILTPDSALAQERTPFDLQRRSMVMNQIEARGIHRETTLEALEAVPRHEFLPRSRWDEAYEDHPVLIGKGQTISQPYIVALMTELLELDGDEKVLEIGTGSGYHAAVMAEIAKEVFTIEIDPELAEKARTTIRKLDYENVQIRVGDGYNGWPEAAPFDAIVLTAAPRKEVPKPLIDQLAVGGRIVAPVGVYVQDLLVLTKTSSGMITRSITPVRFDPMTGVESEAPNP